MSFWVGSVHIDSAQPSGTVIMPPGPSSHRPSSVQAQAKTGVDLSLPFGRQESGPERTQAWAQRMQREEASRRLAEENAFYPSHNYDTEFHEGQQPTFHSEQSYQYNDADRAYGYEETLSREMFETDQFAPYQTTLPSHAQATSWPDLRRYDEHERWGMSVHPASVHDYRMRKKENTVPHEPRTPSGQRAFSGDAYPHRSPTPPFRSLASTSSRLVGVEAPISYQGFGAYDQGYGRFAPTLASPWKHLQSSLPQPHATGPAQARGSGTYIYNGFPNPRTQDVPTALHVVQPRGSASQYGSGNFYQQPILMINEQTSPSQRIEILADCMHQILDNVRLCLDERTYDSTHEAWKEETIMKLRDVVLPCVQRLQIRVDREMQAYF